MTPNSKNEIPHASHIEDLWDRLQNAEHRLLALDYDGTLAPFHEERMEARPLSGVAELIDSIAESKRCTLALISGRPISELLELIGERDIVMIGAHGWERKNPGEDISFVQPSPLQSEGLAEARADAVDLGWTMAIEQKTASVALHTRPMDEAQARRAQKEVGSLWKRLAERYPLSLRPFNGGLELRASGTDKGEILMQLIETLPQNSLTVYIGDDDTDEDAFRAIADKGIGIRVGTKNEETSAIAHLKDCNEVKEFLTTWREYRL